MLCLRSVSVLITCVILFITPSGRGSEIIGGKEVEPHSLPFMAYLRSEKSFCGGVLIHEQWVLTAAHCARISKVILGAHSIKKQGQDSKHIHVVKKHFPHPNFSDIVKGNDLMLLKLKERVTITKTVKWLNLSTSVKDPAAGSKCLVAGWGKTQKARKSDVLMAVNVTVIDRQKCNSRGYYNRNPVITSDMICAGSLGKKEAGTCNGDSGGPLLCNGELVGVTSFGPAECGKINTPAVYSFLSKKQLKWIKKTMK